MNSQESTNVLLLIDRTNCASAVALDVQSAISHLAWSPSTKITIVAIVSSSHNAHSAIQQLQNTLFAYSTSLHPNTSFSISVVPEETCQIENAILKIVVAARPELIVLSLSGQRTRIAESYLEKISGDVGIIRRDLYGGDSDMDEDIILEDQEDSDWFARNIPRCSSPIGWD